MPGSCRPGLRKCLLSPVGLSLLICEVGRPLCPRRPESGGVSGGQCDGWSRTFLAVRTWLTACACLPVTALFYVDCPGIIINRASFCSQKYPDMDNDFMVSVVRKPRNDFFLYIYFWLRWVLVTESRLFSCSVWAYLLLGLWDLSSLARD